MRSVFTIGLLLLLFSFEGLAQSEYVKNNLFSNIKKLNSVIDLQNVDYDLINLIVLHYTNEHRVKKKNKRLIYNKTLGNSALLHSLEMKTYNFFSHTNKRNRKYRNLEDRAKFVSYQEYVALAENLYYGFIDLRAISTYKELGKTITQAFIDSRSHNLNLLDKDLTEIGQALVFKNKAENGFIYYYFTQSFGTR
jgi:uncharacterized protein YkwD